MLTVHIDHEIIINDYLKTKDREIYHSTKFIDFIKDLNSIIYGTIDDIYYNILSSIFLQDAGESQKPQFNENELINFYEEIKKDNPYQIFFIDLDDIEYKNKLNDNEIFLIGFSNNYYEIFNILNKKDYYRINDEKSEQLFKNWHEVLPDLPINEIIISDPYLFEHDDNHKLEDNYYTLLKSIENKYKKIKTIIIFTHFIKSGFNDIRKNSKKIFSNSVNLLIIPYNDKQLTEEHDRYIFFNYCFLYLGSSANRIKSKAEQNKKKTSSIKTHPLIDKDNWLLQVNVLKTLKENYDKWRQKKDKPLVNCRLFNFSN